MKKLLYLGLLSVCVLLGSCVEKNVFNAFDKVERYTLIPQHYYKIFFLST
jgi:hypothetical protein